jgi:hypothetical protein
MTRVRMVIGPGLMNDSTQNSRWTRVADWRRVSEGQPHLRALARSYYGVFLIAILGLPAFAQSPSSGASERD